MINKTWIEISKSALLHNVGQFLSLLDHAPAKDRRLQKPQFMAVVKSNAYGHGLREVTGILHNSKFLIPNSSIWFGVDNLDEARAVREITSHNPVLVLGYTQSERLKEAAKLGARITVYNWETLKTLTHNSSRITHNPLRVHVKVETGTTRQGVGEDEAVDFVRALKKIKGVEVEGISTHFADSEDSQSDYALKQLARYNSIIKRLNGTGLTIPIHHMACSAATLLYPQSHGNLVRVGIGMYGLWPFDEARIKNYESRIMKIRLRPVLTWKAIVAQVKDAPKGTPIGYNLTERVKRDSKVAVLPVGYWDGYDRGLSGTGEVLVNGKRCKILGRVCMNMLMVDMTDAGNVKPEDEAVLIGAQGRQIITADEIAKKLSTINYEIVTRINPVLPRLVRA
ncbi:alanine racemase [Candidatus Uhrbacteria bacterium RIFCSPLOWO2_01_FULL_47_24]|uniref:Alanine racemase n=1 Tax=Candidatus Uhrbacteria bacterium RIFCSPLOWO2_01_FULL_47_24 TaxID=1802401 RepID=A0A1F7URY9_9BACT|nr:MAG: alanine racemase [Candidatus Uhrbacteria bacterium RIFCSPHIGHO2_01_FULL_47_11]OGL68688.1 MAG: alanine racemase [Candidatus Uhrbacteria bacterium RIFCSPHIGHO2_02_FULL_46_47]OGL74967.1 MAG: alanine racemase [Candidatus Uhrbacteria bacterium RIFCSPHIGHO2_12_FULL_47_11]OGL81062.1 MAG: alanine racemase [Candidatus Uhrbacteria bacterium RIFCSPLOWO2_01_FULL_47_24]OGL84581.1 MAG: alanine racemase [Candidatus Uhrbacteria bacterium RIFCSPLOWO2_02_FULL_46_25]OGL93018.1 MAG: alanine racemase [Cand